MGVQKWPLIWGPYSKLQLLQEAGHRRRSESHEMPNDCGRLVSFLTGLMSHTPRTHTPIAARRHTTSDAQLFTWLLKHPRPRRTPKNRDRGSTMRAPRMHTPHWRHKRLHWRHRRLHWLTPPPPAWLEPNTPPPRLESVDQSRFFQDRQAQLHLSRSGEENASQ